MSKKVEETALLRRIYKSSASVYVILAATAFWLMSKASYQLTLGHLAKDDLASTKSAVLVPGSHAVVDLQMRYVVVVILLLSAVVPILYVTKKQKDLQQGLKKRVLVWRWIDLAVTTALMVEVVAMVSGVQDIFTLKIIGGIMALTCALGWLAERAGNEAKKLVMPIFVISLVLGALPWVLIAQYALITPIYASARAPWYIYALYFSSFGGFTLLALNQWRQHLKFKQWKDYLVVERDYAVVTLIVKAAFAIILIVGLRK